MILTVLTTADEVFSTTLDGGNVDFYRKPLSLVWFVVTLLSLIVDSHTRITAFISRAWWLQIVMMILIFICSALLVHVYKVNPRF